MKPDRRQQIDRLLNAAREMDAGKREAFLDEACAGDASLRAEVDASLAFQDQAESFVETPAPFADATLLAGDALVFAEKNATLFVGQTIAHYEVRAQIGAGGMGEVYLAQDTRLNRPVALKLLSTAFANDPNRLRRFEHEARAASALNHPNILTVYEIGHVGETHFIATEYVDGETLRRRMTQSALKTFEILDISAQIAAALVAAHQASIVHRDIKPENVMLRADGYVKVLDFGIAKLVEQTTETKSVDSEAQTALLFKTEAGMVLGTVAYMSPEQVRGQAVDARTDIWSLGCMIYEMAGGRAPFEGRTSNHVAVSILDQEPAPLSLQASESSETLQWIINKALRKDKDERYQTAKELLADLRNLQQRFARIDSLERSAPLPHVNRTDEEQRMSQTLDANRTRSADSAAFSAPSMSSAEYLIGEIGRRKKSLALLLLIFVVAASFAGFSYYGYLYRRLPVQSFNSMNVTRLATVGEVRIAVISPDGKYIAHVLEENGKQSLWIRQTAAASGNPQIVVPAAEVRFVGATFSRDSNYLYYVTKQRNNSIGAVYQVPALGGAPVKLLTDVDSPVALSPDNSQIAFARASSSGESSLLVANADGTNERRLAMRTGDDFYSIAGAAWSPDGTRIACGAGSRKGVPHMSVVEVSLTDGTERTIASQVWGSIGQIVWLKDGSGLILTAVDQAASTGQLWYLDYTGGADAKARRITNDLNNYSGVSLTTDAGTLVTLQGGIISNIWSAPAWEASESRARQLTASKYDGLNGLFWMPDNKRLIYTSSASGKESLWIVNADGTGEKQLSSRGTSFAHPSVSPDGRYAYFISDLAGARNIWRLEIEGGDMKQLSTDGTERYARISPDGQRIFYSSTTAGKTSLWRMNADGSLPVQLTEKNAVLPVVSPDGKLIACYYREEPKSLWKIAVLSAEDGALVKTFDIPTTVILLTRLGWTPDGRSFAYIDDRNGVSNLWSQPVDGGKPVQLTDFKTERIFAFNWSRDGRQLACARGSVTSDVVAVTDFK